MPAQDCLIGYYALTLSILKSWTPERAWAYLGEVDVKPNKTITNQDIEDMIQLKKTMTYTELGEVYGITRNAVYRRIKRYQGGGVNGRCESIPFPRPGSE